jgi:hypothetical protein
VRSTPLSAGSVCQTRPSKRVKVWPRQKSGAGARTRITTSSPRVPRIEVSIDASNPG